MRSGLPRARVDHLHARLERALVDANEREVAVLVADRLEDERDRRLRRIGLDVDRLVGLRVRRLDLRLVERRGQERADAVQQALHALVAERRAAEHRGDLAVAGGLADAADHVLERDLLAGQELVREVVARLGELLLELRALRVRDLVRTAAGSRRGRSARPATRRRRGSPASSRGR